MYVDLTYRKTFAVHCGDGDKPFRAWKKRHGRDIREFRVVPSRDGGGWTVKVLVPQQSAIASPALAELMALMRDYCQPEYLAPMAEHIRQREARDARRADGYDMAVDPLTVAAARR